MKNKTPFIIFIIITLLTLTLYASRTYLADLYFANSYTESEKVENLRDSLDLTPRASLIFRATHPVLAQDGKTITDNCYAEEFDSSVSIRGCHKTENSRETIYVYNIESEELRGITESTTAHELLHAVWSRLPARKKSELTPLLTEFYDNSEKLKKSLESYEPSHLPSEIFARLGTEYPDLDEKLEEEYSKVFTNRTRILEYYDSYNSTFETLYASLNSLEKDLTSLKKTIEDDSKAYEESAQVLSDKISVFNDCAATPGCSSTSVFYSQRAELEAEKSALEDTLNALNEKINQYNSLAEEYNSHVLHSKTLNSLTNPSNNI